MGATTLCFVYNIRQKLTDEGRGRVHISLFVQFREISTRDFLAAIMCGSAPRDPSQAAFHFCSSVLESKFVLLVKLWYLRVVAERNIQFAPFTKESH
jgi:hypothetical protein